MPQTEKINSDITSTNNLKSVYHSLHIEFYLKTIWNNSMLSLTLHNLWSVIARAVNMPKCECLIYSVFISCITEIKTVSLPYLGLNHIWKESKDHPPEEAGISKPTSQNEGWLLPSKIVRPKAEGVLIKKKKNTKIYSINYIT